MNTSLLKWAFLSIGSLALAAPLPQSGEFEEATPRFFFKVEIDGVAAGEFIEVSGLGIEREVIVDSDEPGTLKGGVRGRDNTDPLVRKRPGRVKYGDITLKKGYVASSTLNDWIEEARFGDQTRKSVSVIMYDNTDPKGSEVKRWNCFECFPKSWKMSSLDGKGNDVLTEEVVIVIEWFEEA